MPFCKGIKRVLGDQGGNHYNEDIDFLQNLSYFKSFSYNLLEQISYLIKKQKFQKGQAIFIEGDQAELVYIIKEGEFKVYILYIFSIKEVYSLSNLSKFEMKAHSQAPSLIYQGPTHSGRSLLRRMAK